MGRVKPTDHLLYQRDGLKGLFHILDLAVDHALIIALVEHWRPEMHTLHLPHREMGITLQDIEVMLRVPVDGLSVIGKTNLTWKDLCTESLGFTSPPSVPHSNENKSVLVGERIQINWLAEQFRDLLAANASDVVVWRYARYHILLQLGFLLFMDKSAQWISLMPLQFFDPISDTKKYSWGSATLSWLY